MTLWRLPPVLIVHLKRFLQDPTSQRTEKIDCEVNFPTTDLVLDKWLANSEETNKKYQLFATVHHFGNLGGGHYVADAQNLRTNQWYHFDDQTVSTTTVDKAVKDSAYVLFYKLQDGAAEVATEISPAGGQESQPEQADPPGEETTTEPAVE